jgi:hypothetical protein
MTELQIPHCGETRTGSGDRWPRHRYKARMKRANRRKYEAERARRQRQQNALDLQALT